MTPDQIQSCTDWQTIAAWHAVAQREVDELKAEADADKAVAALTLLERQWLQKRLQASFAKLRRLERRSRDLGKLLPACGPKAERIRQLERENERLRYRIRQMEGVAA